MRKDNLVNEQVYHVFSKSIAGYNIFNTDIDYSRIVQVVRHYQKAKADIRFSRFIKLLDENRFEYYVLHSGNNNLVEIVAYCVMPTHIHLILKQKIEGGISKFMNKILNSYTRYFNVKHNRKGPLWEGRFKSVLVETNEYLLHLTRYIHLNPVSLGLIDKPEYWKGSSYNEYTGDMGNDESLCNYNEILEINPNTYREFVEDRISYQQKLQKIKSLLFD